MLQSRQDGRPWELAEDESADTMVNCDPDAQNPLDDDDEIGAEWDAMADWPLEG